MNYSKRETFVAENGKEFESEVKCKDYCDSLKVRTDIGNALSNLTGSFEDNSRVLSLYGLKTFVDIMERNTTSINEAFAKRGSNIRLISR